MTVAALILGIIGTVLAASSLGWNVASYLLSGARPKLRPVIGLHLGGDAITSDGTVDARPLLRSLESQTTSGIAQRIIGVEVISAGRTALPVAKWAFRIDPAGTVFQPPADDSIGCPKLPCIIPPGGSETFFTTLDRVHLVAAASAALDGGKPQQLVVTVTSGGQTRISKPFFMPAVTVDPD